MSQLWYEDGLRFRCTRCGNCCTGTPGYVWVNHEELTAIAEYRNEPEQQVIGLYSRAVARGRSLREKANGDCIFYDPKEGCTIYPVRPRQCRTWPFWESNVNTPEAWRRTCQGRDAGSWSPQKKLRVASISFACRKRACPKRFAARC